MVKKNWRLANGRLKPIARMSIKHLCNSVRTCVEFYRSQCPQEEDLLSYAQQRSSRLRLLMKEARRRNIQVHL